jgi:hypothetical protein
MRNGERLEEMKTHLFVLSVSVLLFGCSSGAQLVIVNESDVALRDVVASGRGFSQEIGSIPPHGRHVVVISGRVAIEASLQRGWEVGILRTRWVFESGGDYRVTVTVSPHLEGVGKIRNGLLDAR